MEFIKLKQWSANVPGPTMAELIETVKKGRKYLENIKNYEDFV